MPKSGLIPLHSGRVIHLRNLRQWEEYADLLEGLPTVEGNARRILSLLEEEHQRWGITPHLIPPVEQPIECDRKYPFGTPSALPSIGCVGYFTSMPARDQTQDYSALVIIWYQDEYAFPIDPEIMQKIQALHWEELANDDFL